VVTVRGGRPHVGLAAATKSYVDTVPGAKPDERAVLVDGTVID
jgi:hypothetical protein